MAATDLLQHQVAERPIIYAYSDTRYPGMLKVGFTARPVEVRMKEHYPTLVPGQSWKVELVRPAMREDGSVFSDKAVHRVLRGAGIPNPEGEWFICGTKLVEQAVEAVRNHETTLLQRTLDFRMRPEQEEAVQKTAAYFEAFAADWSLGKAGEGVLQQAGLGRTHPGRAAKHLCGRCPLQEGDRGS